MCGIFGIVTTSKTSTFNLHKALNELASLSESRGKESSGFAFRDLNGKIIKVLKGPLTATNLIKTQVYKKTVLEQTISKRDFCAIGHSRLVTNGTQLNDDNNQPVIKDGVVAVHNGIIVNENEIYSKYPLKKDYEIDTEVLLSLTRNFLETGYCLSDAVSCSVREISGTVSSLMFFNDLNYFVAVSNNGSLYILKDRNNEIFIFASEKYILEKLADQTKFNKFYPDYSITQIKSNTGCIINLENSSFSKFNIFNNEKPPCPNKTEEILVRKLKIEQINIKGQDIQRDSLVDFKEIRLNPKAVYEAKLLEYNIDATSKLRRCTKCVLPETFPFIDFDENGVCNYCRNYILKNQPKPLEELYSLVEPYRNSNGSPDCIIPFSGGRDSSYTLHYVKNVLHLNPITFTYDWGMVTDLARRNIARMCGKLGVENIIVSANIKWKRDNIRKNISAWLKKPSLGMIPLFMAGDKYFFYYTNIVKRNTNIDLNIWGINNLENTDFKVGFNGIPPQFTKKHIYALSLGNQIRLFSAIGKNLLSNPSLINSSVFDTLGSFVVRYISPKKDYYHMFDYLKWDEKVISDTLINEYDWETASDTKSTWRIGDGTAGFYNYIYYTVCGFSENDTFRSNQIREGMITRNEALEFIKEENFPRYETIKWYLNILGLDFRNTINIINKIPKKY